MARVVKDPTVRRKELIACAQQLFYTQGYDNTSVNDIVTTLGIAKGTFYHYFDSKLAILEAMVDVFVEDGLAIVRDVVADESLNALEKWQRVLNMVTSFKTANRQELMMMLQAMQRDENLVLRIRIYEQSAQLVVPEYAKIIAQGVAEGVFDTLYPEETAAILLGIGQSARNVLTSVMLHPENYDDPIGFVRRRYHALQIASERVLGAEPGSMPLIDEKTLAIWFG